MTGRSLAKTVSLFLSVTTFLLFPELHAAQPAESSASIKSFVGTWNGTCADGAEFVVLKVTQSGDEMAGTVSIANMNGADGQCAAVIDPPTDQHAMKIHDVQLQGRNLVFKGAGRTAFEMSVVSDSEARLKFRGTPVENNPWKLKRSR